MSTDDQAENGASLPAQRATLSAEAERRGWDLEIVADEGASAHVLAAAAEYERDLIGARVPRDRLRGASPTATECP